MDKLLLIVRDAILPLKICKKFSWENYATFIPQPHIVQFPENGLAEAKKMKKC